ncbi:rhodanese-like domain-containing protein [Cetobacterium ceti]
MIIEIGKEKALELLNNHQIMVIDARLAEEVEESETLTEDTINLTVEDKNHFDMMVNMLPKDVEYLIYSNNGISSLRLARTLEELGFERIYNLTDGIENFNVEMGS